MITASYERETTDVKLLCKTIICIAYPSLLNNNRPNSKGGHSLPSELISDIEVKNGKHRAIEYYVKQEVVDGIRNNIKDIEEVLSGLSSKPPSLSTTDGCLISNALACLPIARTTNFTEERLKFGIGRLNTGVPSFGNDSLIEAINQTRIDNRSNTHEKATVTKQENTTRIKRDTSAQKKVTAGKPANVNSGNETVDVIRSSETCQDSQTPINTLRQALPENTLAKSLVKRYSDLLMNRYRIEVVVSREHILVKTFSSEDPKVCINQAFIDRRRGIITREY